MPNLNVNQSKAQNQQIPAEAYGAVPFKLGLSKWLQKRALTALGAVKHNPETVFTRATPALKYFLVMEMCVNC